jgi:hypothetical protein
MHQFRYVKQIKMRKYKSVTGSKPRIGQGVGEFTCVFSQYNTGFRVEFIAPYDRIRTRTNA